MSQRSDLDFLQGDPVPVRASNSSLDPADLLPQHIADQLLNLPGVDGAWIERQANGSRRVVLHVSTNSGLPGALPTMVEGLPVMIVGGEPIRAGG